MSEIAIIAAPYHLGVEGVGVGAGPIRLLDAGLGSGARVLRVRLVADPDAVLDALDGVNRGIRFEVAAARKRGFTSVFEIVMDPTLAPFRAEPRFQAPQGGS